MQPTSVEFTEALTTARAVADKAAHLGLQLRDGQLVCPVCDGTGLGAVLVSRAGRRFLHLGDRVCDELRRVSADVWEAPMFGPLPQLTAVPHGDWVEVKLFATHTEGEATYGVQVSDDGYTWVRPELWLDVTLPVGGTAVWQDLDEPLVAGRRYRPTRLHPNPAYGAQVHVPPADQ